MKPREAKLDHDTLTRLLDYDPATGVFRWKAKSSAKVVVGAKAGFKDNGYIRICLYGDQHMAHRLAWFYVNGVWPLAEIDHIDMDRSNNSIKNLRDVPKNGNSQNRKKQINNTTGFKGVSWHPSIPDRYTAQIHVNRKKLHLGVFDTAVEAHAAYVEASTIHHKYGRSS